MKRKKDFLIFVYYIFFVSSFFAQTNRPIVYDISAKINENNQIDISWKLPSYTDSNKIESAEIAIFRTTSPSLVSSDLSSIKPLVVLPSNTTSFTDSISTDSISIRNIPDYYYTVMLRPTPTTQYTLIIPGVNATVIGVKILPEIEDEKKEEILQFENIEEKQAGIEDIEKNGIRKMPLPYLNVLSHENFQKTIKPETIEAAVLLGNQERVVENILPYIFRDEQIERFSGEEFILYDIINNQFSKRNFSQTIKLLNDFLNLNRSKDTTTRSIFYLGECYYFIGKYRLALTHFLQVQENFPELTGTWIQATLNAFDLPQSIE